MHPRAEELIQLLGLLPHPEGGFYAEVYRSPREVQPNDIPAPRSAVTTMYFLITQESPSRWHRIASDEIWHHHEGAPVELLTIHRAGTQCARARLGAADSDHRPLEVVPAGCWQAARTLGDYSLVGCTVGPGFEFADFELLADHREHADGIAQQFPDLAFLI